MGLLDQVFPRILDARLGELRYSFGAWTTKNAKILGQSSVALRIPGSRSGPDADSLRQLEALEDSYAEIKKAIAPKLFELYRNIADSADMAQLSEELGKPFPQVASPEDVWGHVTVERVWFGAYGVKDSVEIAYFPAWEVEHTAGAIIRNGSLIEFSASVGPW